MIIKNMFSKPIDRDIKGVIKVGQDDDANIKQELEEYVVTRELQKHFSDFFSSYKRGIIGNTDKMGVWISGFFGSGKSHFLKILSYLLENKEVGGKKAIDYFVDDNKIADQMVLADMKLAGTIPTDVVLFNIDSKSEVNGKQSKEAIVSVLQNVFNEMQGFSGSNPFLADLERKLTEEGKYDLFKEKFEDSFGSTWEESRSDFDFIQDDVVEVLDGINFMSIEAGRNWCEKATGEYAYKVEDFARLVKKYLDKKESDHHIVFLIDEIGQYIGDDSKLMLNLQTVTEDLGTACGGKAWIIVTSQQDIDSITKTKGNDFSKIQGRFDTRLSLSSANVDEVIKKRILEKNEAGKQTLTLLYDDKATVIKNLILFNDGVEKKLYSDRENFADIYPFIPYQFNLLGSVLTSIRTHGASGKHLAEGERSMLALFKESAVKVMNDEPGTIVPFNMFYDALEQFLDHSHKGVISRALDNEYLNPNHEKECFDVNVLKTLFMIKYVKEIKANIENITSLMVSNVNDDRMALAQQVEDALKRLVRQTLVQKNGDIYVFLTDEEQEINRAIESQNVDSGEVIAKVSEMIFDGLYDEKKYRYPAFNGRYAFAFNQVVDDKPYKANQNNDITLKILTPNSDERADETTMRILSGQSSCVLVVLPDDRTFLDEIRSALQIEKFIRFDATNAVTQFESIKEAKKVEMRERNGAAKLFLSESLKNAEIYVNGDKIQSGAKEIASKINDALGKLVSTVYHKLSYIDTAMSESDIRTLFKNNGQQLTLAGTNTVKRTSIKVDDVPYQYKNRKLQIGKSYTSPDFSSHTVLTDDIFTYIDFYFSSHKKAMKYRNPTVSKIKYGDEKKYHYSFYWKQAMSFYKAAKTLPMESVPLVSYYSMLNAVKAFLAFKCDYIEDFVEHFSRHGLFENTAISGNELSTIHVGHQNKGVFVLFGRMLEQNFDTIWAGGKPNTVTLKKLLYNLAFIHRAYITTYNTPRGARVPELFIPVKTAQAPCYYKENDSNLYLKFEVDHSLFGVAPVSIPVVYVNSISSKFKISDDNNFVLQSVNGAKRNQDSLSSEFKNENDELRREFQYIRSSKKLWYLKRTALNHPEVMNLNSMLIIMAAIWYTF